MLVRTDLSGANLSGADLSGAYLEGTKFRNTTLFGTTCYLASVDGRTVITKCAIDGSTDFTGVGLSGSRVDPKLHSCLLRNIRKIWWEDWYAEKKTLRYLERLTGVSAEQEQPMVKQPYVPEEGSIVQKLRVFFSTIAEKASRRKRNLAKNPARTIMGSVVQTIESVFVNLPVRLFWMISDYGSKTWPIVGAFILLNVFFTFAYLYVVPLLPAMTPTGVAAVPLIANTTGPVMGVMQTTMILFSITDIATKNLGYIPMLFAHVLLGYFILAALVTRFSVMFQNQSP